MKNTAKKIYLLLLIGVIYMSDNSCFAQGNFQYGQYVSKDPELNISLDYISGWLQREHRGKEDSYASLLFFEDRVDRDFKAKMGVTVKKAEKTGLVSPTAESFADDLTVKRLKFKDAKLLSKSKTQLEGLEAWDILLSYLGVDKIYSVDAKPIRIKERIVVFERDGKFYYIRYENIEQEFDKFSQAFDHVLSSLRFKDK